jgi:hypothetical protein
MRRLTPRLLLALCASVLASALLSGCPFFTRGGDHAAEDPEGSGRAAPSAEAE